MTEREHVSHYFRSRLGIQLVWLLAAVAFCLGVSFVAEPSIDWLVQTSWSGDSFPGHVFLANWAKKHRVEQYVGYLWLLPALALLRLLVTWCCVYLQSRTLRERYGHPMCPKCGYNISASPMRCPECGLPLTAAVSDGK